MYPIWEKKSKNMSKKQVKGLAYLPIATSANVPNVCFCAVFPAFTIKIQVYPETNPTNTNKINPIPKPAE